MANANATPTLAHMGRTLRLSVCRRDRVSVVTGKLVGILSIHLMGQPALETVLIGPSPEDCETYALADVTIRTVL